MFWCILSFKCSVSILVSILFFHCTLCLFTLSPISKPSRFIPDFQHPLPVLGPSILALRLLLSLPSTCLSPWLSNVKCLPFTHLHLIFSHPSLSLSHLPSHFSNQVYLLKFVCFSFFSTCFFFSISHSLNEPCRGCQSSLSLLYSSQHASTEMEGRMEGWWQIWCAGGVEHVESQGQPLKRGGPNQKDALCLESLTLVICWAASCPLSGQMKKIKLSLGLFGHSHVVTITSCCLFFAVCWAPTQEDTKEEYIISIPAFRLAVTLCTSVFSLSDLSFRKPLFYSLVI